MRERKRERETRWGLRTGGGLKRSKIIVHGILEARAGGAKGREEKRKGKRKKKKKNLSSFIHVLSRARTYLLLA